MAVPDLRIVVTVDGKQHHWRLRDMTAADSRDFRQAVGMRLIEAFLSHDLDAVAGLLWLDRRRAGERVSYEEVAGELSYDSFDFGAPDADDADAADADEAEAEDAVAPDPEASAGS